MKDKIYDDGFQPYLTYDATFVGTAGIPMLMDLKNADIPKALIPFGNIRSCKNRRKYVHFYQHDKVISPILKNTKSHLDILKTYDGVITPDPSLLIGRSACIQQANTFMNRAVGFYLQKNGIPVIPNIRWSDESSFSYCFLGVPKNTIVAVSTHGCIHTDKQRAMFKKGLSAMLIALSPSAVLVHGYMPDSIFADFINDFEFHRYASEFEKTHLHGKEVFEDGNEYLL